MGRYSDKSLVEVSVGGWSQEISLADVVEAGKGIKSDPAVVSNSTAIENIVALSQADYSAIPSPDPKTLYIISG